MQKREDLPCPSLAQIPTQNPAWQVYHTFLHADSDGSGKLEVEEFISAFLGVLKTEDGEDEEALAKLFCR